MRKKILAAVISLLLLFPLPVFAEDRVPDLETKAADLTVSFVYTKENGNETGIEGAEFAIYKVANLTAAGGSVEWQTVEPYRQFAVYDGSRENTYNSLDTDASITLAEKMAKVENKNAYSTGTTGKDGKVTFGIQPSDFGMYLVVQTKEAEGYTGTDPFLVSAPEAEGDPLAWNYAVTVAPKKAVKKIATPTPTKPVTVTPPTNQDESREDKSGNGAATGDQLSTADLILPLIGAAGMTTAVVINLKDSEDKKEGRA